MHRNILVRVIREIHTKDQNREITVINYPSNRSSNVTILVLQAINFFHKDLTPPSSRPFSIPSPMFTAETENESHSRCTVFSKTRLIIFQWYWWTKNIYSTVNKRVYKGTGSPNFSLSFTLPSFTWGNFPQNHRVETPSSHSSGSITFVSWHRRSRTRNWTRPCTSRSTPVNSRRV